MLIRNIRGLKYPDEFLVRFFFKERLHQKIGKVLELGCSNGSNLSLFYQYGWDVVGVDIDDDAIEDGISNFNSIKSENHCKNSFSLSQNDMIQFVEKLDNTQFDTLILASSIYYLQYKQIVHLLKVISANKILKKGANLYIRIRKDDDYRFGKGIKVGQKSFKLDITETGEKDCYNTFFSESEILDLFNDNLPFSDFKKIKLNFENYQENKLIANSELIIYGKLN
jgi:SAM-dependent methyltransferase